MAKKEHISETQATQLLRKHQVAYEEKPYPYEEHGGTSVSARELGVPEHEVIKTLVMQDEAARPLIVLMHGDCKVSTKNLARAIGCKSVEPCKPEVAQRHAGYMIGGTSPFGTKKSHARVCRGKHPGSAAHLYQGRPARLSRGAGATGAARCAQCQASPLCLAGLRKCACALSLLRALVYILLRRPRSR